MLNQKRRCFESLNFDNKGVYFINEVVNNVSYKHNGKDTTTFRSNLFGTCEEVHQKCFCCGVIKPMSQFPTRSRKRINYFTFGITESWCRDCWKERNRARRTGKRPKYLGATLESLFD